MRTETGKDGVLSAPSGKAEGQPQRAETSEGSPSYLSGNRLHGKGKFVGRDAGELPAVVLLDLELPRVDGLEVPRAIREDARTKLPPVVILTSSKEEQGLLNGYRLGADSYVRKPVDFARFVAAVKRLGLYRLILNEAPPSRGRAG